MPYERLQTNAIDLAEIDAHGPSRTKKGLTVVKSPALGLIRNRHQVWSYFQ